VRYDVSLLGPDDLHLFAEGTHEQLYLKLGAHPLTVDGGPGTYFAVWAPTASGVAVVGDWNGWRSDAHPLRPRGESGIWEGFVPGVGPGALYKFRITPRMGPPVDDKADPFGFRHEMPPRTASVVWRLEYAWDDGEWMAARAGRNALDAPWSVYEVHLGSWMRVPEEGGRWLTYRELAPRLAEHARRMGFTHVEIMPVMEHPFYGSWGYQITGYFAPTARYGSPQDFMYLIDHLHRQGIGVVLDWVPSHFSVDGHGLARFDGTHLYEHADPRQGRHPDWNSCIFNYGRHEVRSFLLSAARFWLDRYHADALRVDGVASMLYLDYSRPPGEWVRNEHGGRENLAAIRFLRRLNEGLYRAHPDTQTVAEESTSWPLVSRPTHLGGLGFGMKWDLGWMHDRLAYLATDPIYRKYRHNLLSFRALYAHTENFVLPLSHDEVVHGKGSLLEKMPGDDWQKFANLRLLLGLQFTEPGKKLLFMGDEFAQRREWGHDRGLDWQLAGEPPHAGVMRWVADLNAAYRGMPALHARDFEAAGFEWVDCSDADQSVIAFLRRGHAVGEVALAIFNFTPVPRHGYRLGLPAGGFWREVLNSDARVYGGSGQGNLGGIRAEPVPAHGRSWSGVFTLPPLAVVIFAPEEGVRP
jgi:1,4-alpha-glucan branching enzyme